MFQRRNQDLDGVCSYLDGGVELVLIHRFNSFQPLDDRLDVAADLTLEGRGSSVVHRGVDGVSAR